MPDCLAVIGTDTDAGKTVVTAALARAFQAAGKRVSVIKAVQTGCTVLPNGHAVSPDVVAYRQACPAASSVALAALENACSPHLAARMASSSLSVGDLHDRLHRFLEHGPADVVLLETAGGLFTPINDHETLADLLVRLGWPVLLVAANKLGAINHTLLTLDAARGKGLDLAGWLLNTLPDPNNADDPLHQAIRRDNVDSIAALSGLPCLAVLDPVAGLTDDASPEALELGWQRLEAQVRPVADGLFAQASPDGQALLDFDRAHVWHPYTSATRPLPVREAVRTGGNRIVLRDGSELIDGMSSWWCAIHGYNHPRLLYALRQQAGRMPHVMFGGLTHEPAVSLARQLLALSPAGLEHVFFADSGSVAVEVALKMALQYHQARGSVARTRFLTVCGGYHGDTLGCMSVSDPETGMHGLFRHVLPQHLFAPRPACRFDRPFDSASVRPFAELLRSQADSVAAVILEPIVQGAGGMWFSHPEYLRAVAGLCRDQGCLLILDEIATGFGRTGKLFACEHAGVSPDILCLGKGLTGGMMTLAATLCTPAVARTVSANNGLLMHGPTFMANPLACAVASASLELLQKGGWQADVPRLERGLRDGLRGCAGLPGVADVRVLGTIGVVEMQAAVNLPRLQDAFVSRGVWLRPFGRLIYVMPPYCTADADLAVLTGSIREVIEGGLWR